MRINSLRISVSTRSAARMLLHAWLPGALLAAGFLATAPAGQAQSTSLNESFNGNALPASLEAPGMSPIFSGGVVTFPGSSDGDRRYLQTKANYNNTNFIAEATVTVTSCCAGGGSAMAFFGIGQGTQSDFFSEPRNPPTTYVRIAPNSFGSFIAITTSTAENIGSIAGAAGDGTHRVRLSWDHTAKSFTVSIQKNYTGGPFTPTSTIGTAVNEAFGATNSHIFFGGAGNSVFDDLLVIALDGTPGAIDCHGQSVSGLVRDFGNAPNAAAALGFPSVNALQNLITGFCGN